MESDGIGIRTFVDRNGIVEIGAAGYNGTKTRHALMEFLGINGPAADEIVSEAIAKKGKWLARKGVADEFLVWLVCTESVKSSFRRSTFQLHLGGLNGSAPKRLPYRAVEEVYGLTVPEQNFRLVEATITVPPETPESCSGDALAGPVGTAPWLSPLKPHRRRFLHLPAAKPCLPLVLFAVQE